MHCQSQMISFSAFSENWLQHLHQVPALQDAGSVHGQGLVWKYQRYELGGFRARTRMSQVNLTTIQVLHAVCSVNATQWCSYDNRLTPIQLLDCRKKCSSWKAINQYYKRICQAEFKMVVPTGTNFNRFRGCSHDSGLLTRSHLYVLFSYLLDPFYLTPYIELFFALGR